MASMNSAPRGLSITPKSGCESLSQFRCCPQHRPHPVPGEPVGSVVTSVSTPITARGFLQSRCPGHPPTVSIWGFVGTSCHSLSSMLFRGLGFDSPFLWVSFGKLQTILLCPEFSLIDSKNPSKARTQDRTAGVLGRHERDVHSCACPTASLAKAQTLTTWVCFTRTTSLNTGL